jgi:hypothetical protein
MNRRKLSNATCRIHTTRSNERDARSAFRHEEELAVQFTQAKWLVIGLFVALLAPAGAAPTPVPGGANGVSAISGKLGDTVFSGVLRIKIIALREATDAETRSAYLTPTPNQKVLYMQSLLRNGTHDEFVDLIEYTLADKDDVSVKFPTIPGPHILQGASGRQQGAVLVDRDFVPVKLIVQCSTCSSRSAFRSVRFTIPAH